MMSTPDAVEDRHVRLIREILKRGYLPLHPDAKIDIYRWTPWSIRIRIVEPGIAGLGYIERDQPVYDLFEALPDDTFQMISLLFLLAPEELEDSPTNDKFEAGLAAKLKRRKARADAATKEAGKGTGRASKASPE